MRKCMLALRFLSAFALLAAAFPKASSAAEKLKVLRTIPHSGYSEGLDWHDGFLWNAFPKESLKIDPKDGTVVAHYAPASEYNESLVWWKGTPFQVSYSDDGIYRGEPSNGDFRWVRVGKAPEAHAWGSTHDGKHVILTGNYSKKLYFFDPKTWKIARTVETSVPDLEDLAWDGQRVWASSFTTFVGTIFPIDPKTGAVDAYYELPDPGECPVIDGLAWDGEALWMTGKHCAKIYRVERPSPRALSSPSKKTKASK